MEDGQSPGVSHATSHDSFKSTSEVPSLDISHYEKERKGYLQHFAASTNDDGQKHGQQELRNSPLLSLKVKCSAEEDDPSLFPQYGLLGMHIGTHDQIASHEPILMNTNAPTSTFLCGSQGAGKSHSLACMLENALLPQENINTLIQPLAGVVFHYYNDGSSVAAEVADLCANGIKVRVLVSRSNYHALRKAYMMSVPGANAQNMTVHSFLLQDGQLTVQRMLQLMSFSDSNTGMPLYMDILMQILRDTAVKGTALSLSTLEDQLAGQDFAPSQRNMLNMRLALLRGFCASSAKATLAKTRMPAERRLQPPVSDQDVFRLEPGTLTIIDLSDPFVDASTVCVLFKICLELITAQKPKSGLVVALDEAHKYLNASDAAADFTEQIPTTIRMQRHNATRVIVATQEPTISPLLLDLCSVTIVHRFSSPAWYAAIKGHLSGASDMTTKQADQHDMFQRIVGLGLGESLVFSPASYLCGGGEEGEERKLGSGFIVTRTRRRRGRGGETRFSV
ncbi:hypothetical protein LTR62_003499 [Meristemomyces frigidus]|uniref:AAA+ ATPase domain-containing protein n=1 Tax=Meristemomyces frigidus TaxID=1508187 RepID=A0AAN7TJ95_9PEZI|nr:hypothetical protein LTR62_003499 [Meristemomyces frigidus]